MPGYKGINGEYGIETLKHFFNIRNGVYNMAYQSRKHDVYVDEQTGYSFDIETNESWVTSNDMIHSWIIQRHIEEGRNKNTTETDI